MRTVCTVLLTLALLSAIAFAKKFPMSASSIVPAARGEVDVSKDKNGNTKLKMKAEHLAKPGNLTPPQSVYVIWLQERGGNPENQGQLKVDDKLKASFETVTPSKAFDLFVTGEPDAGAKTPNGPEVMRVTIQQ